MEIQEFILRLLAALGAGFLIGIERQMHRKSAGLRTNSLVALGSAIFVLISLQLAQQSGVDNTRVIGQVVTGVGFLGAGVILHQGISIYGLTTAATIWCSAALGCLAATGFFLELLVCTGLVLLVNFAFRIIDDWIAKKEPNNHEEH